MFASLAFLICRNSSCFLVSLPDNFNLNLTVFFFFSSSENSKITMFPKSTSTRIDCTAQPRSQYRSVANNDDYGSVQVKYKYFSSIYRPNTQFRINQLI